MFIWDFVAETVLGQIVDWIYGQVIGFLGNFFAEMGNMGVELFEMSWVQSIVLFFPIWPGRCMVSDWWWPASSVGSNIPLGGATSKKSP